MTTEEITALGFLHRLPLLPEKELQARGYDFCKKEIWQTHVVESENFFSGQNTASAHLLAEKIIKALFSSGKIIKR